MKKFFDRYFKNKFFNLVPLSIQTMIGLSVYFVFLCNFSFVFQDSTSYNSKTSFVNQSIENEVLNLSNSSQPAQFTQMNKEETDIRVIEKKEKEEKEEKEEITKGKFAFISFLFTRHYCNKIKSLCTFDAPFVTKKLFLMFHSWRMPC